LTADDLDEIDSAAAQIQVQGARYPEHLQRLIDRYSVARLAIGSLRPIGGCFSVPPAAGRQIKLKAAGR
jgi:hypothetical protein